MARKNEPGRHLDNWTDDDNSRSLTGAGIGTRWDSQCRHIGESVAAFGEIDGISKYQYRRFKGQPSIKSCGACQCCYFHLGDNGDGDILSTLVAGAD